MPDDSFDPAQFVDRLNERELFAQLLSFGDDARILELRDKSGTGKSHVLKMLQYTCRTSEPRVPVALVDLKQLPDLSPLAIIKAAEAELRPFNLDFSEFIRVEAARVSADFSSIRGAAYFENARFQGARNVRLAGTMNIVDKAENVHISGAGMQLSPEQEQTAQDVSIRSFCAELSKQSNDDPVVLLLDSLELTTQDGRVRKWLFDFLDNHAFDMARRPGKLVVVLAGQSLPRLDLQWPGEHVRRIVRSVQELQKWTRDHVAECLRSHGFAADEKHIEAFHRMIEIGVPPSQIVQTMRSYLKPVDP
jgi:hypothetical protein